MEARQHEKGGAIDTGVQRQSIKLVRFVIFRRLQAQKNDGKTNGNAEPTIKLLTVTG